MQALLFEVEPRAGHEDHYFSHAAALRPLLKEHTGLIFIDRFKSLSRPEIILSHSHWRDEAAIAKWRIDAKHHKTQAAGRNKHFKDYRIRISHVLQNYARGANVAAWSSEGAYSDPETHDTRLLTIIASEQKPFAQEAGETYLSVNFDETYLTVASVQTEAAGRDLIHLASRTATVTNAMLSLVTRDYGMFEREEAPQYFEPIAAV